MKPDGPGQRGAGKGARKSFGASRLHPIPMEWMDPMSWRLPSGKALAEFALQAGFLAPLMLSGSHGVKRAKKPIVAKAPVAPSPAGPESSAIRSQVGEEPEHSGTFRDGAGFREGSGFKGR
jgi:hypothetical protein